MSKKLNAYKMYIIYCIIFALLNSMIFTVVMLYQVEIIHLSPLQLILAGTTFEIVCFVFEIPTGMVADLYSRKLSIIIGVAMIGIGSLIQGRIPNYIAVIISQILWGIGSTFTSGALEAWIAGEELERNIDKVYMNGAQAGQIGSVIGILLATILGNYSLSLPISLSGGLLVLFCIFLFIFMPEAHFSSAAPEELNTFQKMGFTFISGIKLIKTKTILVMIMLTALFSGLASEGYDRLYTAHFLKDTIFPSLGNLKPVTWFGIFGISAMVLSTFVMQIAMKVLKDNYDSSKILLMTNLFYMFSMLVFGLTKDFSIMLTAYLLLNIIKSINKPIMTSLLNKHITGNIQATILSTNGQINSLGEMIGGPIIGVIANLFSIAIGIASTVVFMIPIILIFLKIMLDERYLST